MATIALSLYLIPTSIFLLAGAPDFAGVLIRRRGSGRLAKEWSAVAVFWPWFVLSGLIGTTAVIDTCEDADFDCRECDRADNCIGD